MLKQVADSAETLQDSPFPSAGRAWWTVAVLMILSAMSVLDRQVLFLMVDRMKADLHIDDFQFSLMQGISFALFYAVFGLPFGWMVDRFARRWVVLAGVTIWSLATVACGLAQSFTQLLVARFAVGAGEASLSPAAFSLLSDTFPRRRLTMATAVFATGTSIGSAIALVVGGLMVGLTPETGVTLPLVGHVADWQLVFIMAGLPCLAIGWVVLTVAEPRRQGRTAHRSGAFADVLRLLRRQWRFYLGHFFGFGLYVMCNAGLLVWSPTYLKRVFHWHMIVIAPVLAVSMSGMATIGALIQGALVQRWFAKGIHDAHLRLFIFFTVCQVALMTGGVSAHNPYVFLGAVAVGGLGASVTGIAASALQLATPTEFRGRISAAFLMVYTILGMGLGSVLMATFTTHVFKNDLMVGWSIAATFLIIMPIAALFLISALKPMREAVAAAQ